MYINRQTEIMKQVAEMNGVSYSEVVRIFDSLGRTINSVITANCSDEQGLVDIDKLKCISVVGFGKFYPKKGFLKYRNEARKNNIENNKNGKL